MLSTWRTLPFLLVVLLVSGVNLLSGQHPHEQIYTMEDGLPSLDLNGLYFSVDGSIWANYVSGEFLSRYDGTKWTIIRFSELGLPSGMSMVTEDKHGLWLYKQEPNEVTLVRFQNEASWKKYSLPGGYICTFNPSDPSLIVLDRLGKAYTYSEIEDAFISNTNYQLHSPPKEGLTVSGYRYWFNSSTPTWSFWEGSTKYAGAERDHHWHLVEQTGISFSINGYVCQYYIDRENLYLSDSISERPIQIRTLAGQSLVPQRLVSIKPWAPSGQIRQPAVVVKNPLTNVLSLYTLDSLGQADEILSHVRHDHVYNFAQDKHGNWWYATASGIVRTNPAITVFDTRNPSMVTGLQVIGEDEEGLIWIGGYDGNGGFARWDGHEFSYFSPVENDARVLPGFFSGPDSYQYYFMANKGLFAIGHGLASTLTDQEGQLIHGYYLHPLSTGEVGMGLVKNGLGLGRLNEGKLTHFRTIGMDKGMSLINVQTLAEDRRGRIWMGRLNQGLAIYDPARDTAVTWPRTPATPNSIGALSTCVDREGTLWLGAHNGLYRLPSPEAFNYLQDDPRTHLEHIPLPGHDTSRVSVIHEVNEYLVIGTVQGLYFKQRSGPRIFTLRYGEELPVGGTEQNAVLLDSGGKLWIGTESGALSIDMDQLVFDTSATTIQLISFAAGGQEINIQNHAIGHFPAEHRNISFSFLPSGNDALQDALFYDISIFNEDQDTLYSISQSRDRHVNLAYIPSGQYTIHIVAFKHGVECGSAHYTFRVNRLLKENPWFWTGLSVLVAALLLVWFWSYSTRQRQALHYQIALESARRERDALKAKALGNFFNPHFLNNSLHWVQSRYRKDPETAVLVGRLAQNVDLLFANTRSGQVTHSLRQELTIVENYLRIQEIRFGQGLITHVSLPEENDWLAEVQVPALMVQIHTENAIESGIRNRPGACHFNLDISRDPAGTLITIEDDGRGRPEQQINGESTHNGSTSVMENLIELFNQYNAHPIRVDYEDRILVTDGVSHGTRVRIYIPTNYRYDFS